MTLADAANIALIVAATAALVTTALFYRELRMNNRLTRAANTQTLVDLSTPFYLGVIRDRAMAEIYLRGATDYATMDPVDQYRYRHLLTWWLIFHENVYYQWRNNLLDDHSYKPWEEDLKLFAREHHLSQHWTWMEELFQKDFGGHVSALLKTPGD